MDPAAQPSGAPVSGGVVTAISTVVFSGLADQGRYVAFAAGIGVRFTTATSGLQQSVAVPDRERIKALELGGASSGGGGGGGTPGSILVTAPGDTLPSPIGQAATTLWIRMRE